MAFPVRQNSINYKGGCFGDGSHMTWGVDKIFSRAGWVLPGLLLLAGCTWHKPDALTAMPAQAQNLVARLTSLGVDVVTQGEQIFVRARAARLFNDRCDGFSRSGQLIVATTAQLMNQFQVVSAPLTLYPATTFQGGTAFISRLGARLVQQFSSDGISARLVYARNGGKDFWTNASYAVCQVSRIQIEFSPVRESSIYGSR